MPLIHDEHRHTDRRPRTAWPWIVVAGVFVAICMAVAVIISLVARAGAPTRTTASLIQAPLVLAEQQFADSGNWQVVLQYAVSSPPDASYTFNDQHTYYVLGERAYRKLKKPRFGAAFQSRYRAWAAQIKSPQCQACHTGGGPGK